jgi:hypothetical protein
LACEPFDCDRCGERHSRCTGHVDACPACGLSEARRKLKAGDPCPDCQTECTERPCIKWPRKGAPVCVSHGGNAPQVKAKAVEAVQAQEIRKLCTKLGQSRDIDDISGLIELLRECAGNVEFYRQLVQELPTHPEDDEYVAPAEGVDGYWKRGDPGLYGRSYHVSGIPTGEAKKHILVVMYDEERDRWAKLCLDVAKLGIDERLTQIAEADAKRFYEGVGVAIKAAALNPEQIEAFRVALASHLRSLAPVPG